jgi:2-polyprenyl-3-methyl-5-hydroxy-6-metoxy-1,4-benzoquinol methylase
LYSKISAPFETDYFKKVYQGDYDRRNPRYKHRSYLREVRRVTKKGLLLDVGCAYGAFLKEAIGHFEVHGCDISAHATQIAASRVPSAKTFQSEIFSIQGRCKYDVITCFDVLEHVPDVDSALAHLLELLKPGGALVITVPVYDTIIGNIVERLDKDPTHVHKQSRYHWINLVAAAGFQHLYWKGILRYYLGGPLYLHYCGRTIRRFAPAILVTGLAPLH